MKTYPIIYMTKQVETATDSADRPALPASVEITPEMVEAGMVELCAYDPDRHDPRAVVRAIVTAVLANPSPQWMRESAPSGNRADY